MSASKENVLVKKDFCTILINSNTKDLLDEEELDGFTNPDEELDNKEENYDNERTNIEKIDLELNNSMDSSLNGGRKQFDSDFPCDSEDEDDYDDYDYNDDDDEVFQTLQSQKKRRKLSETIVEIDIEKINYGILNLNELEFEKTFNIRKRTLEPLINAYSNSKRYENKRFERITADQEIHIHLYYLTRTDTLSQICDKIGIDIKTLRTIIKRVMDYIASEQRQYIKWPSDLAKTAKEFSLIAGMPGVIGVLACNNIMLKHTRLRENKSLYYNYKLKELMSRLLAVFDANKKFTKVFIGAPGSMKNSSVLAETQFVTNVEERERRFGNYYILADSSFPCSSWLITPFERQDSNNLVDFNRMHANTQILAEQAMHLFQKRFPRLNNFGDYINFNYINKLILSACILHNMFIDNNDVLPIDDFAKENVLKEYDEEELDFSEEIIERRAHLLDVLVKHNVITQ